MVIFPPPLLPTVVDDELQIHGSSLRVLGQSPLLGPAAMAGLFFNLPLKRYLKIDNNPRRWMKRTDSLRRALGN